MSEFLSPERMSSERMSSERMSPERMSSERMSAPIPLTPDNVDSAFPDLPRAVRLALGFGSRLRHGTLEVTLPDGRKVLLGGIEPGPSAAMTLSNYGFASRLLNGGDI